MRFFDVTLGKFISTPLWSPVDILWSEETIGVDLETSCPNNDWKAGGWHNGKIELLQVYLPSVKTVCVLDFQSLSETDKVFIQKLRIAFHKGIEVIAHNASFEYTWIRHHLKVAIKRIRCTMVANQMLDAGLHFTLSGAYGGFPNSLAKVCQRKLGIDPDKVEQTSDWSKRPLTDSQLKYSALDPYLAYTLYIVMLPRLKKQGKAFEAEMLAVKAFSELQCNGMPADMAYLIEYRDKYLAVETQLQNKIEKAFADEYAKHPELISVFTKKQRTQFHGVQKKDELKRQIAAMEAPFEFDYKTKRNQKKLASVLGYGYSSILGDAYFESAIKEALQDPKNRKLLLTKKAQENYDKWLECVAYAANTPKPEFIPDIKVSSPGQVKGFLSHFLGVELVSTESGELTPYLWHPLVTDLVEYRHIAKLRDYLDQYIAAYRDGAVYASYSSLAVQGIGRTDSSAPNLQNVPKHTNIDQKHGLPPVREVFRLLPDNESTAFGLLDAAGSHLQIARDLAQDANLLKALRENIKVHFITSQSILKINGIDLPIDEVIKAYKDKNHDYHKQVKDAYPKAKTVIYAFLNLSGARRLETTFKEYGDTVPLSVCADLITACKTGYSGLYSYTQKRLRQAEANRTILYDKPNFYAADKHIFEACGIPLSPHIGKAKWLGEASVMPIPDGRVISFPLKNRETPLGVEKYLDGAAIVAATWLAIEATALKLTLGRLALWGHENPQYKFKLRGFAHDEVIFTCAMENKEIVGKKVYETMRDSFREVCPEFAPENDTFDGWITTWQDK